MLNKLKYVKYYFMSYDKILEREDEIAKQLNEGNLNESEMQDLVDELFGMIKAVLYRNRKDKEIMDYADKLFNGLIENSPNKVEL